MNFTRQHILDLPVKFMLYEQNMRQLASVSNFLLGSFRFLAPMVLTSNERAAIVQMLN